MLLCSLNPAFDDDHDGHQLQIFSLSSSLSFLHIFEAKIIFGYGIVKNKFS